MLSVKPSSQIEPLGAWSDKNLTVEWIIKHQHVSTDQCAYWCLRIIYISTDEISFWVDTIVCPMNNINCMRAFECISVTSIVTCKWFNVGIFLAPNAHTSTKTCHPLSYDKLSQK